EMSVSRPTARANMKRTESTSQSRGDRRAPRGCTSSLDSSRRCQRWMLDSSGATSFIADSVRRAISVQLPTKVDPSVARRRCNRGPMGLTVRRTPRDTRFMIETQNLTKRLGGRTVVQDVSFRVEPGTVTGFLGRNGAGKTTTLRMLTGLSAPDAGKALVLGTRYRNLPN